MAEHSILPPSGAEFWSRCPAWVTMAQKYPSSDSVASREGTAAHWVAQALFEGGELFVNTGDFTPFGVVVTQEMVEGGELFVNTVKSLISNKTPVIEQRVAIEKVHQDCFGTPDLWAYSAETNTLHVIEYKFGHRFVNEFQNDQMTAYSSGILSQIAEDQGVPLGQLDQQTTMVFTVVQPRCFYGGSPVRTWTTNGADLRARLNKLAEAAKLAMGLNPPAVPGSYCHFCVGYHACPSLQKSAYAFAEMAQNSSPVELTGAEASLELRMLESALEIMQARVEGLRETVAVAIRCGKVVPFHQLEQGFGRKKWNVSDAEVIALGELMGVPIAVTGVKTPTQAIAAGILKELVDSCSIVPAGSQKLVPCDASDASRIFH